VDTPQHTYINLLGMAIELPDGTLIDPQKTGYPFDPVQLACLTRIISGVQVDDLPVPVPGNIYIVTRDVARFASEWLDRTDLVTPDIDVQDLRDPSKMVRMACPGSPNQERWVLRVRYFMNLSAKVWKPAYPGTATPLYPDARVVQHDKTQDAYRIYLGPERLIQESTGIGHYAYRERNSPIIWLRPWYEMEDGRFTSLD
jgi:hypothetical protein